MTNASTTKNTREQELQTAQTNLRTNQDQQNREALGQAVTQAQNNLRDAENALARAREWKTVVDGIDPGAAFTVKVGNGGLVISQSGYTFGPSNAQVAINERNMTFANLLDILL